MVKAMDGVSCADVVATEDFSCDQSAEEWLVVIAAPSQVGITQASLQVGVCFARDYPMRAPRIFLPAVGREISVSEYLQSRSISDWGPSLRITDLLASIGSAGSTAQVSENVPESEKLSNVVENLPAEFAEIFRTAERCRMDIPGGAVHSTCDSVLAGKKTRSQLSACTDYEHICLSILGMAKLKEILPEILCLNNGKSFQENPGTKLMERECGFTMHADRSGVVATMRDAPDLLLAAFQLATRSGQEGSFFSRCFERRHDPCLEGRVALFVEYLEQASFEASTAPIKASIKVPKKGIWTFS